MHLINDQRMQTQDKLLKQRVRIDLKNNSVSLYTQEGKLIFRNTCSLEQSPNQIILSKSANTDSELRVKN